MAASALALLGCGACSKLTLEPFDPGRAFQEASRLSDQASYSQAQALIDRAAARYSDENSPWHWRFHLLKAELFLEQDNVKRARPLLDAQIPEHADLAEARARLLFDRGWAKYDLSRFDDALELLNQAHKLAAAGRFEQLLAEIELRRGAALARSGKPEEAGRDIVSALSRSQNRPFLRASALGNLGVLWMNGGRYDEAIQLFGQTVPLWISQGAKDQLARELDNLASCYFALGEPEKALTFLKRAEQAAPPGGETLNRSRNLGNVGDYYRSMNRLDDARRQYVRALAIARKSRSAMWIGGWLNRLATVSIQRGDLAAAREYNNEAAALGGDLKEAGARLWPVLNAARIAARNSEWGESERLYRSILESGLEESEVELGAESDLAGLLSRQGRTREAEGEFEKASKLIDRNRSKLTVEEFRLSYFSTLTGFYQQYVEFLSAEGRPVDALRVADASRARVLSEKLGIRQTADRFRGADFQRLASGLKTVFLCYWLAPERSYLWVVAPAGIAQFQLPRASEIAELVDSYNALIDDLGDPLDTDDATGRKLSEILLDPAAALIPPGYSVAVVLDGRLNALNLEALPAGPAKNRYWIEERTVSVAPSLTVLLTKDRERRPQQAGSLLLIGDPETPDEFPPLPNAAAEIEAVRSQYPSGASVLRGPDAYPQAYRESQPERFSMIHFTAHAIANREDPLDSAVILSLAAGKESYKLYARDILNLPIQADLVTISACRSAGARTYTGEGLVGFAWAFLHAGAGNVVAGLWEVDDRSTASLMGRMYGELRAGKPPAEALRTAKRALMASSEVSRKPYYWAPFELFTRSLGAPRKTAEARAVRPPPASATTARAARSILKTDIL